MKKIELSNKYVATVTCHNDRSITICSTDKHMFELLLERLWGFAEAVDTGTEKVTRNFTYTSDANDFTITFGENITQAIIVLHTYNFINDTEKSTILASIKTVQNHKSERSLLQWIRSKYSRLPSSESESNSLLKKE